jgi:hypothetical protein
MKRNFIYILFSLLALLSVGAACSNSSESEDNSARIIGKWKGVTQSGTVIMGSDVQQVDEKIDNYSLEIDKDGSYISLRDKTSDSGNISLMDSDSGKWVIRNDSLLLMDNKGKESKLEFKILALTPSKLKLSIRYEYELKIIDTTSSCNLVLDFKRVY